MQHLNADCAALIAAASKLPISEPRKVGTIPAAQTPNYTTEALESLQRDSAALHGLMATFSHPTQRTSLRNIVDALLTCSNDAPTPRHAYVTGIGKSGAVALRAAVGLRSIGVAASPVHGAEFHHGDFGTVRAGDVAIILSNSGKTAELLDVAHRLRARGCTVASITSETSSPLASASVIHVHAPCSQELLRKVPTRSIIVQEAVVNCVLTAVANAKGFREADFIRNHPGGSIAASVS